MSFYAKAVVTYGYLLTAQECSEVQAELQDTYYTLLDEYTTQIQPHFMGSDYLFGLNILTAYEGTSIPYDLKLLVPDKIRLIQDLYDQYIAPIIGDRKLKCYLSCINY